MTSTSKAVPKPQTTTQRKPTYVNNYVLIFFLEDIRFVWPSSAWQTGWGEPVGGVAPLPPEYRTVITHAIYRASEANQLLMWQIAGAKFKPLSPRKYFFSEVWWGLVTFSEVLVWF